MKELAVNFRIVGAVAGGFRAALGGAANDVRALGQAIRGLEQDPGRQRFEQYTALKRGLSGVRQELSVAERDLRLVTAEMDRAGTASREMTSRQRAAERRVEALRGKFREQATSLRTLRTEMRSSGESVEALAERHRRLEAAAQRARAAQERLAQVQARRQEVGRQRAEMRGGMLETVAIGAAMALPVREAMRFESVMADVRKVVDFDTPQQFAEMQRDIQRMVTEGGIPMTAAGIGEIVAAAGQAGIAREELTRFASDAAKMGVAFDMAAGDAGSAMTGMRNIFKLSQEEVVGLGDAYNHLSNKMDAKARDILNIAERVGSSARVFGLSGQQLGALGATMLALKTPPETAARSIDALLNRLANADKMGAGFQRALSDIGLDAQELKDMIEQDAQGALLHFLEAVKGSDDMRGVLFEIGGQDYSKHFVKLVDGLDGYKESLTLIAQESEYAGSMQAEFAARAATTENNLQMLRNTVGRLANAVGSTLLPPLNIAFSAIGRGVNAVASLAESFPRLTQGVTLVSFGFVGLRVASFGLRFAWLLLKGGALDLQKGYYLLTGRKALATAATNANTGATVANAGATRALGLSKLWTAARTGVATVATRLWTGALWLGRSTALSGAAAIRSLSLAKTLAAGRALALAAIQRGAALATGLWTAGQWALNAAMLANPMGLLAAGGVALAGVAVWLLSKWEPVRKLFAGIWNWGKRLLGLGNAADAFEGMQGAAGAAATEDAQMRAAMTQLGLGQGLDDEGMRRMLAEMAGQGAGMDDLGLRGLPVGQPVNVAQPSFDSIPVGLGASGGTSIDFHPTIHVSAPGGDPKAVRAAADDALRLSERRLEEMIEDIMRRRERLSYG